MPAATSDHNTRLHTRQRQRKKSPARLGIAKAPTGIRGLDEVTGGGLPVGRPTLVCGGAGSGKTLLAMEFLIHGALEQAEPGVFMAFEETERELAQNMASLGFDLEQLIARQQLVVDYVYVERSEIEETGEYDLGGLFIRLGQAIDSIGAKRVVLDTLETLFGGLSDAAILRAELRRLFRWLKARGVTVVITAERGEGTLTRHGLEEYVSDCVLVLDQRVNNQLATRRLRVLKYRGSAHGTNEYPFLIGQHGLTVLPLTSLGLQHPVSDERVSTGIRTLDAMLGGRGVYRGSSVLVTGTAGSGKSSVAGHFAVAAAQRGERCLLFAFEESPNQIARNMRSIGLDFEHWQRKGRLHVHAVRPTFYGLEMHLTAIHEQIETFSPDLVVVDPITSLLMSGSADEVSAMLVRLIDTLKSRGITALFTSLTSSSGSLERTDTMVSSLIDTWLILRDIELNAERNRALYLIKSRGMAHSNQLREFILTDHGVELLPVYTGPGGVLTGAARVAQEAQEQTAQLERTQAVDRQRRALERKRQALEAQIAALQAAFDAEQAEALLEIGAAEQQTQGLNAERTRMAQRRNAGGGETLRQAARPLAKAKSRNGAPSHEKA